MRFVKNYGKISKPLAVLLRKKQFKWSEEVDRGFQQLKKAMFSPHVLALLDFYQPIIIETDAPMTRIGVVLMQEGIPWLTLARL